MHNNHIQYMTRQPDVHTVCNSEVEEKNNAQTATLWGGLRKVGLCWLRDSQLNKSGEEKSIAKLYFIVWAPGICEGCHSF